MTLRKTNSHRLPPLLLSALLSLPSLAGSVVPMSREMYMMFGAPITNCVRTTRGIKVDFWTAHYPPYYVGVYPAADWLGQSYFAEVVTSTGSAYIPGDYTDVPVIVRVLTTGRMEELMCEGENLHRQLTGEQVREFRSWVNHMPVPSIQHRVKMLSTLPKNLSTWTVSFPRYYGIQHDGISVSYASAATSVTFSDVPVPGSASGEENLKFWTVTSHTGSTYDPHTNDLWCLWSSNSVPQYMMYKDGPMYRIEQQTRPAVTNTIEELYEMARAGITMVTYDIGGATFRTNDLTLARGTLFNTRGTSYTALNVSTINYYGNYSYTFGPVTNTFRHADLLAHPPGHSPYTDYNVVGDYTPGKEVLFDQGNMRPTTSQDVYLPRLARPIPLENSPVRFSYSHLGYELYVPNDTSYLDVFGIPPASNNLIKIHYAPGDEPSPALIERTVGQ
jgi:hypothetical protein